MTCRLAVDRSLMLRLRHFYFAGPLRSRWLFFCGVNAFLVCAGACALSALRLRGVCAPSASSPHLPGEVLLSEPRPNARSSTLKHFPQRNRICRSRICSRQRSRPFRPAFARRKYVPWDSGFGDPSSLQTVHRGPRGSQENFSGDSRRSRVRSYAGLCYLCHLLFKPFLGL